MARSGCRVRLAFLRTRRLIFTAGGGFWLMKEKRLDASFGVAFTTGACKWSFGLLTLSEYRR